jgi:hypothetical protein
MKSVLEVPTDSGGFIPVEIETIDDGRMSSFTPGGVVEKAAITFEESLEPIRQMINSLVAGLAKPFAAADAVEVTFGLKFSAKLGVLVAQSDGEASLSIKLIWKPQSPNLA